MLIAPIGPWFLTARGLATGASAVEGLRWGVNVLYDAVREFAGA